MNVILIDEEKKANCMVEIYRYFKEFRHLISFNSYLLKADIYSAYEALFS